MGWRAVIGFATAACAACTLLVDTSGLAGKAGATEAGAGAPGDAAEGTSDAAVDAGDAAPPVAACTLPDAGAMIDVGGYCVDRFEVTNAEYGAFLAATDGGTATADGGPPFCAWNVSNVPSSACADWPPPTGSDDFPARCVTWCDAWAYCAWAKKRLCGRIGGGPSAHADVLDPTRDQWFQACSRGGTRLFPYGGGYSPSACNGADSNGNGAARVGSFSKCEGGYAGIFDMSGSVWEYADDCDDQTGRGDICYSRGGAFGTPAEGLECASLNGDSRDNAAADIGFRCCLP